MKDVIVVVEVMIVLVYCEKKQYLKNHSEPLNQLRMGGALETRAKKKACQIVLG